MAMYPARFLLVFALAATGVVAGEPRAQDDPDIVRSLGFLDAHPDVRFREQAREDYAAGHFTAALAEFRDAARYADKASQAMIAEMYWKGLGTHADRALAYAWIDLSAERGYPSLIAVREQYWAKLDAAERARAVDVGQAIYEEYGDAAAKPRLEREMREARLAVTGSHLGHVATLSVPSSLDLPRGHSARNGGMFSNPGGSVGTSMDGTRYFDAKYWDPKQYWKWQDQQWRNADPHVEVGAPQTLDTH